MNSENGIRYWFALYTKPKQEFKAVAQLSRLSIKNYLPVVKKKHQWSDRIKVISEPVIKGYIFIYADERERLAALEEFSIVRCVFDHGKPAVIPDWQMQNLIRFLDYETEFYLHDGLIPGVKVLIKNGPFQGVIGVIQHAENEHVLSVSIDMLNRSVLTHISRDSDFEVIKEPGKIK